MNKLIFISLILLFISCTSTLYIVRHAEKGTEPKNNPSLTTAGTQRANDLKELLKNKKIENIYSTNTTRTTTTAKPLSELLQVPIQIYNNDTTHKLFQKIFLSKKNTLIVGHSNTILAMLDTMHLPRKIKVVGDVEFDNIFIIKVKKYCYDCANPFKAKLAEKKYGTTSITDTLNRKM
jgi:broad specificity phosphatase PhoE